MDHLFEFLGSQSDRPVGTIVYIGAGDGLGLDMARCAALSPQRLVLVEGDPETAAELERRVGHHAFVSVRSVVLAPAAGPVHWHRYNLPAFNGNADVLALQAYYPRLRALEQRELPVHPFADLLAGLQIAASPQLLNVLVMDVPGQEEALLAALPEDGLTAIDTVILRGCREAVAENHAAADAAPRRLQRLSFRKKVIDNQAEPLWPVTLMRFDSVRHRISMFERELAAARDTLQQRDARIAELDAAQVALQNQVGSAERRTTEHLQQVQQLTRAVQADAALLSERDAELGDMAQKCKRLEVSLQEASLATESLRSQLAAVQGDLETARTAHAAALRQAEDAAAARAEAARAAMERRCVDAERQLDTARRQLADLEQQLLQLTSDKTRQDMRQQMLQDELQRAEGQIELIKGLLLGEAGL